MKKYTAYCILLLLAACSPSARDKDRIVRRTVFVMADTVSPRPEAAAAPADTSYLEHVFSSYNLVDVQRLDPGIHVNLRYAGTDNFMGSDFYDGLRHAYLPCEVALKLCNAQYYLRQINPALSLVILDATRPLHIQQMMWDSLDMPADRKFNYLSPPYQTSLHNYGCAVDLTVMDTARDQLLDMGTGFDEFVPLSQPAQEWKFLKSGELSQEAFDNRRLLRYAMKMAGFSSIPSEWWHFGYCSKEVAAAKFELIK